MGIDEKLAEIQEQLKDLPPEQQQEKIQEILQQLPPEELQELTKKQCPFCSIANKSINAVTVYEDANVIGILDINPASKGHIILFPKGHYQFLFQVPDNEVSHLFTVVNKLSLAVINGLSAEGTNIFVANGQLAGQNAPHVVVHIIPRYKEDGINFIWEPKKVEQEEMNNISKAISSKIEKTQEVKEVKEEKEKALDLEQEKRIA
jgi:histidine triad (HIT) family protein|tara:strand:+ start:7587 stop:8201 length:615 start_codon:yes stop_codon:yes gene_type:complete